MAQHCKVNLVTTTIKTRKSPPTWCDQDVMMNCREHNISGVPCKGYTNWTLNLTLTLTLTLCLYHIKLLYVINKAQIPLGSSRHVSTCNDTFDVSSRQVCWVERVERVLLDKLDTAKIHGLYTSNVSSRDEPSGIWAKHHWHGHLLKTKTCRRIPNTIMLECSREARTQKTIDVIIHGTSHGLQQTHTARGIKRDYQKWWFLERQNSSSTRHINVTC